jgi:methionyl-tRNA formyltransferase
MKVLVLTNKSIQNKALCAMLAKEHELTGIVYENQSARSTRLLHFLKKSNYNPLLLIKKLYEKMRLRKTDSAIQDCLQTHYGQHDKELSVNQIEVKDINSDKTNSFINAVAHDILVVSGTRMIKEPILSARAQLGIINLHTGLSPYYNGGPSCTFWSLYNEEIEYIGSTVMFIDQGIDSGNIILSDTVKIEPQDTHASLEFKAIDLGNKLVLQSLRKIANEPDYKGIPQKEISEGKTYYNSHFIFQRRKDLEKRLAEGLIKKQLENPGKRPTPKRITS